MTFLDAVADAAVLGRGLARGDDAAAAAGRCPSNADNFCCTVSDTLRLNGPLRDAAAGGGGAAAPFWTLRGFTLPPVVFCLVKLLGLVRTAVDAAAEGAACLAGAAAVVRRSISLLFRFALTSAECLRLCSPLLGRRGTSFRISLLPRFVLVCAALMKSRWSTFAP